MTNVCQNWGRIEVNKKNRAEIWLNNDPYQTITDEGLEEEYKCHSDSPNYCHLRCLLSSDIYIFSDINCGNEEHII